MFWNEIAILVKRKNQQVLWKWIQCIWITERDIFYKLKQETLLKLKRCIVNKLLSLTLPSPLEGRVGLKTNLHQPSLWLYLFDISEMNLDGFEQ